MSNSYRPFDGVVYAARNRATGELMGGNSRRPVYTREADAINAVIGITPYRPNNGYRAPGRIVDVVKFQLGSPIECVVATFDGMKRIDA